MNRKVIRNMVFMSVGKAVSLLGSSIYTFAMSLYVLKLTGSGLSFAMTLVLGTLSIVLINPVAGAIADRIDRKLIVVMTDLLNGCFLLGLLIYTFYNGMGISVVYISTFTVNVITVIFDISLEASIPDIVTGDRLMSMNSVSKAIESAAAVLGPMLSGIIYSFIDIRIFIAANAVSFIFSAIMEYYVDFRLGIAAVQVRKRQSINIVKDIRSGAAYMKTRGEISGAFLFLTVLNFFIGFSVLVPLPYILNNVLVIGSANYGIVQAAFPVGALLGAVLVKRRGGDAGYMGLLLKASAALAYSIILIIPPVFLMDGGIPKPVLIAYYCVIMGTMGIAAAFIDIPLLYMLQTELPEEFRGRVLSLGMSLVKTASPFAFILSGILLDILPKFMLPLTGALMLLVYTGVYRRRPGFKHLEKMSAEKIIKGEL